ncbi:hypothetical protein LP417_09445 [Polaromonas sp. P1-6]|nr:hypothetical protein LP417_09445 [Polaromonas sp. P1-6]
MVTPFAALCPGAGTVEEVETVGWLAGTAENEGKGRRALVRQRRRAGDAGVRAIGGDEVHD